MTGVNLMNKSTDSIPVTDLSLTDIANIFHAVGNLLTTMQEELLEKQRIKEIEADSVIEALELENKRLKENNGWISVNDQMPQPGVEVEIWLRPFNVTFSAEWSCGSGELHDKWYLLGTGGKTVDHFYVTHWRKPQPPKDDD